jgi:hypothetical protein
MVGLFSFSHGKGVFSPVPRVTFLCGWLWNKLVLKNYREIRYPNDCHKRSWTNWTRDRLDLDRGWKLPWHRYFVLQEFSQRNTRWLQIWRKDITIRREDVLAAWSGIRPLVRDPAANNTAALVRNHMLNVSPSGLLTIAGGKWTTYRAMASHTIDMAIDVFSNFYWNSGV